MPLEKQALVNNSWGGGFNTISTHQDKIGFDFNSLTDQNNEYVEKYHSIMRGIHEPIYYLLPFLETKLFWMFPKRQKMHQNLDDLTAMIEGIIDKKRLKIQNGEENNLEENEKDLLSLMLESEFKGEGKLTTEELTVCIYIYFGDYKTKSILKEYHLYFLFSRT
jgi:cholesterol 24(S)-hydroxylase